MGVGAAAALGASRAPRRLLRSLCQMVLLLSGTSLLQNVWVFFLLSKDQLAISPLKASAVTDEGSR